MKIRNILSCKKLTAACLVGTIACVAVSLVLYAMCGASPFIAVSVWICGALAVWLPGVAVVSFTKSSGAMRSCLELVFGAALFAVVTVCSSALHMPWFVQVFATATVVLLIVAVCLRKKKQSRLLCALADVPKRVKTFVSSGQGSVLLLLAGVYVLLNAAWSVRYAHPGAVGALVPSQDFFWNLGNAQSFLLGFPVADLRVDGVTVTYHYLTELYQAGLMMLCPWAKAYDIVAFYSYAPLAVALVTGIWAAGNAIWAEQGSYAKRSFALAAMPLWMCCASLWKSLTDGAGRFGNSLAVHTVSNINGQATAFLFLMLFAALYHTLVRNKFRADGAVFAGAFAAFYLLAFAKSPQAAIVAIAVACISVILAFQKQMFRPGLALCTAMVSVGFLVLYRFYFAAGAASSMSFSITGTISLYFFASILNALQIRFPGIWQLSLPVLVVAQTFLAAPAAVLVWVVTAVKDLVKLFKTSGTRLLMHACIVGGIAAFFLFDHYSSSQIYFFSLALFCLGFLLLDQLPVIWAAKGKICGLFRKLVAVLLAVSFVTACCFAMWISAAAIDAFATKADSAETGKVVLTAAEETACEIMQQNMQPDELFATNRMHTGLALEGLSNVYTGLSGRRAWMESFKYAVSNMGDRAGDVMSRYDLMTELFSEGTSPERAREICQQNNISWLIYCPKFPGSDLPFAQFETVFETEDVVLYHIV